MKKIYILFCLGWMGLAGAGLQAQQRSLLSQYMLNPISVNPAVAGVGKFIPIHLAVRRQWVGIKEAPILQNLSGHGYVGKNMGLGINLVNQVAGPSRRTAIEFCYSYQIDLSKEKGARDRTLSFGLAGVMQQYGIDRTQLTTDQPNDQAIANVPAAQVLPEANFGVWLQHQNKYYVGFSATNLVQTKRFINVNPYNVYNQVKRTYYLMGGYRFKLSEHMVLEPSAMLQTMESLLKLSFKKGDFAIPFQTDINSRLIFNNLFYFGVSYRVKDAIVGMAGIQKPSFRIGYSYDYTLSGLTNYNSGSHEIGLTLFLESVPRGDGNMKIKRGEQIPRRTLQFKRD